MIMADMPSANGRSPHGERGLKLFQSTPKNTEQRRSPHGERGLKFEYKQLHIVKEPSLPPRGAWIEMDLL